MSAPKQNIMRTKKMWELTWPEVKEAADSGMGVMLPIGAIEQHGYHLPLITDTILPVKLCLDIAEQTDMIVAPPISYGTYSRPQSGGGQAFVGTTSISGVTLVYQIEDILKEFIRHGFKKIVLFNWHMENSNFIYEAAFRASEKGTLPGVKFIIMETPFDSFDKDTMDYLYPDGFPGWGVEHAAMFETSMMLYIAPELVLMDKGVDSEIEDNTFYDVLPIQASHTTESGNLWKMSGASAQKGERIWKELLKTITAVIEKEVG